MVLLSSIVIPILQMRKGRLRWVAQVVHSGAVNLLQGVQSEHRDKDPSAIGVRGEACSGVWDMVGDPPWWPQHL